MPTPHDYYEHGSPEPHLRNRHNSAPYIEPDWQANLAKDQLPDISTIGRGPRGAGLKLGNVSQSGSSLSFDLINDLTSEVAGTIGPFPTGSISITGDPGYEPVAGETGSFHIHYSAYENGEVVTKTKTIEVPCGATGSLIYLYPETLERTNDDVYQVSESDLRIYNKQRYPAKPAVRVNDIIVLTTKRKRSKDIYDYFLTFGTVETIGGTKAMVDGKEVTRSNEASRNGIVVFTARTFLSLMAHTAWDDIDGKPEFSAVATSGSYADLSDTPTKVTDFTNDAGYQDEQQVAAAIEAAAASALKYKGTVETYEDLPTNASHGDVYNVQQAHGDYPAGTNYAWNGDTNQWDPLSGVVDLSSYATKAYSDEHDEAVYQDSKDYAEEYTDTKLAELEGSLADVATTGSYNDLVDKPEASECLYEKVCTPSTSTVVPPDSSIQNYGWTYNPYEFEDERQNELTRQMLYSVVSAWEASPQHPDGLIAPYIIWNEAEQTYVLDTNYVGAIPVLFMYGQPDYIPSVSIPAAAYVMDPTGEYSLQTIGTDAQTNIVDLTTEQNAQEIIADALIDAFSTSSVTTAEVLVFDDSSIQMPDENSKCSSNISFVRQISQACHIEPKDKTLKLPAAFVSDAVTDVDWDDITGKPNFATVATSGSYNDLGDKPELAAVATSGAYADLVGEPLEYTEGGMVEIVSADITKGYLGGENVFQWILDTYSIPTDGSVTGSFTFDPPFDILYENADSTVTQPYKFIRHVGTAWIYNSNSSFYLSIPSQDNPDTVIIGDPSSISEIDITPDLDKSKQQVRWQDYFVTHVAIVEQADPEWHGVESNLAIWDDISDKPALQPLLESGTNIKTINNQSLLGAGNIDIQGGGVFVAVRDVTTYAEIAAAVNDGKSIFSKLSANDDIIYPCSVKITLDHAELVFAINDNGQGGVDLYFVNFLIRPGYVEWIIGGQKTFQETLVSGTNIKTVNNQSLLGSGNIDIQGGSGVLSDFIVEANEASGTGSVTIDGGDAGKFKLWNSISNSAIRFDTGSDIVTINFLTSQDVAAVAITGSYNDLTNKPELVTRQDVIDIINEVIAARS